MTTWLVIFGALWLAMLAFFGFSSLRKTRGADDYIFAGSNIGMLLGLMTFAATLFSTFTLMGMPDFFRNHGVGAWIFLAISDGAMFFLIIWFGLHLRRRTAEKGFRGVAGLMSACYNNRWAGYVCFTAVFLFLVPYVAIQIRGIAIFLSAVFPEALPAWGWSVAIVITMLIYSEIGGLRAIIYSDVLQGTILLTVIWIIAIGCIRHFGGVGAMFRQVQATNEALLSTPGPQGLLTVQFLLASFLAIVLIPVTQPQVTIRLVIMRSTRLMQRKAVALGGFTMLILLPTVAIGMYGAVHYAGAPTRDFLAGVLLFEQVDIIAAAAVIGLLAAAISTADSQIFALGTELRSLLSGDEQKVLLFTRAAILFFGLAALVFSILSSDELVLLARVSFAGTSMVGPLILAGIFSRRPPGPEVIVAAAGGLLLFLASLLNLIPSMIGPLRLDLLLLLTVGTFTLVSVLYRNYRLKNPGPGRDGY